MAQKVRIVIAPSSNQILLWQSVEGVDTAVAPASGKYQAGTGNDPLPLIITNTDTTNTVYLGGSGVTGPTNGTPLKAGASLTRNVVGNDSEFVAGNGNAVNVSVEVARQ